MIRACAELLIDCEEDRMLRARQAPFLIALRPTASRTISLTRP